MQHLNVATKLGCKTNRQRTAWLLVILISGLLGFDSMARERKSLVAVPQGQRMVAIHYFTPAPYVAWDDPGDSVFGGLIPDPDEVMEDAIEDATKRQLGLDCGNSASPRDVNCRDVDELVDSYEDLVENQAHQQSIGARLRDPDPIHIVKDRFLAGVKYRPPFDTIEETTAGRSSSSDQPRALREDYGDSILLDFKVRSWSYGYHSVGGSMVDTLLFGTTDERYRLGITVRVRLIDLSRSRILWKAKQKCKPKVPEEQRRTLGELVETEEYRQDYVERAAAACVDELLNRFLADTGAADQNTTTVAATTQAQE
jgi:hypothetical protein